MSHTPVDPSSRRILLRGTLSFNSATHPIQALVDSGADESFIDSQFVSLNNIPTEKIHETKKVFAIDGRVLTTVTHRTVPMFLRVSGNHSEQISLYVIPSRSSPLILGLPWLRLHNPQIDWSTQTIVNWSLFLSHSLLTCSNTPHRRHSFSSQTHRFIPSSFNLS